MDIRDIKRTGILIALWVAVFAPLYPGLVREWLGNSDNSHAFLAPFIAVFFVRDRRERLRHAEVGSSWEGMALLVASLLVYLASHAGGSVFPARISMITALVGIVWGCLGQEVLRILSVPLMILVFIVPLPCSLTGLVSMQLQLMATRIAEALISLCSIPVYREGNILYFTRTQLEVAEACSGIRSVTALTMIGLVFACMSRGPRSTKAILVLSSVPIAIFANIVRVTGTGVLAHFCGAGVARGFLHEFSGLAVFAIGLVMLWKLYAITGRSGACDAV